MSTNSNNFIIGENSTIEIESTPQDLMSKIFITCGKNSNIKILGINVLNSKLTIHLGDNVQLSIGPNQLMNGHVKIFALEKSKIIVGENCLWSDVNIWSSDMHKIVDICSKERINHAQDITIGKHVWFGHGALILKGSTIQDDCIVGARSVVTRSTACKPNCIISGNPAKIIKNNITWEV